MSAGFSIRGSFRQTERLDEDTNGKARKMLYLKFNTIKENVEREDKNKTQTPKPSRNATVSEWPSSMALAFPLQTLRHWLHRDCTWSFRLAVCVSHKNVS